MDLVSAVPIKGQQTNSLVGSGKAIRPSPNAKAGLGNSGNSKQRRGNPPASASVPAVSPSATKAVAQTKATTQQGGKAGSPAPSTVGPVKLSTSGTTTSYDDNLSSSDFSDCDSSDCTFSEDDEDDDPYVDFIGILGQCLLQAAEESTPDSSGDPDDFVSQAITLCAELASNLTGVSP